MTGMPRAPESFVAVCQVLYGDLVDPDAIWDDVAKRSPDQADVHVPGAPNDQLKRKVTASLSAVGAGAGALGLAVGAKEVRRHGWKGTPKLTRALVPVEVAGLGGELMATHILHGDTKKKVAKAFKLETLAVPRLDDVITGSRKAMRSIVESTRTTGPKPGTPAGKAEIADRMKTRDAVAAGQPKDKKAADARAKGAKRWGDAAYNTTRVLQKPAGKAAAAGAVVAGGAGVAHERKRRRANAIYLDPYDSTTLNKHYEFEATAEISKIDDDKRLVFGWLSVSKINGAVVVDRQNDYIDPGDLEEAAYAYVHGSRVGGDMHGRALDGGPKKVSDLVESVVFTPEKIEKMGLPADFPVGWWGGFKVHDDQAWDDVKKGLRTGFSVHGRGRRTDVDLDELMGS